eukprot:CAMPEP_0178408518 /NCGR_PEP_ID=MMETSP0689_2-20121128/19984_1 /TAXON_ID=160604 /ORGANISM="Amphidinium massartii, Strain CS-259" /LENGTH=106 /DNA_ID=CAMNT_0020029623 /DNA_START=233 /DNA_END=553 /DNA_ORIENTATION=-
MVNAQPTWKRLSSWTNLLQAAEGVERQLLPWQGEPFLQALLYYRGAVLHIATVLEQDSGVGQAAWQGWPAAASECRGKHLLHFQLHDPPSVRFEVALMAGAMASEV